MARPTKSVVMLDKYSQTKGELNKRKQKEDVLKGDSNKLIPPSYMNDEQKELFVYIRDQLDKVGLLGNLDIYILTSCIFSIYRLQQIESMINNDPNLLMDKPLLSAKDKYTKDLYRCCNELCLSPQSRAKLANMSINDKKSNPLLEALSGD